ncbi:hypothetical protein [Agrobacterium sp. LAD9]|uniref:hypothetical protein n=1 Tax=Agrobacterium sp. LAD9 TaxID=2055153 RepID=UPI00129035A2
MNDNTAIELTRYPVSPSLVCPCRATFLSSDMIYRYSGCQSSTDAVDAFDQIGSAALEFLSEENIAADERIRVTGPTFTLQKNRRLLLTFKPLPATFTRGESLLE